MKRKGANQDLVRKRKDRCSAAEEAGSGFGQLEQERHLEVKLTRIDEVFTTLRSEPKVALPSQRRSRGRTCFCFSCESCISYNSKASYENRLSKAISDGEDHLCVQRQNEHKTRKSMRVFEGKDQIGEQKQDLGSLKKKRKTFYNRKGSVLQSWRQKKRKTKKGMNVYKSKVQSEEQNQDVCSSKKIKKTFHDRNKSDQHFLKQNEQEASKTAEVYIDYDLIEEPEMDVRRSRRSRKILDTRSISPEPSDYLLENIGMSTSKTLKCEKCAAVFHTWNSLKFHQRLHTKEFPFACSVCSQAFCFPLELKEHMDGHIQTIAATRHSVPVFRKKPSVPTNKGGASSDLTCKVCLRGFRSYIAYEKHCLGSPQERQNHSLYQCFLCESCWFAFKTVEQWKKHMVSQHRIRPDVKPPCVYKWLLQCQSCDKMFENFCLLRGHFSRIHVGKSKCVSKIKPLPAAEVVNDPNAAGTFSTEIGQNEGQAFGKAVEDNADTLHVEINGTRNQTQPGAGRWLRVVVNIDSTSTSHPPDAEISIYSPSPHSVAENGVYSTSKPTDTGSSTSTPEALENYSKKAQFIINSGSSYFRCEVHQLKSPSDHSSIPKSDSPSSTHETHKNKNVISAPALLQMINKVKEKNSTVEVQKQASASGFYPKFKSDIPSSIHEIHKNENVISAPALLHMTNKVQEKNNTVEVQKYAKPSGCSSKHTSDIPSSIPETHSSKKMFSAPSLLQLLNQVKDKDATVEREWKMVDDQLEMNKKNDGLKCPDMLKLKVLQIQYEKSYAEESPTMEEAVSSAQKQVQQTCSDPDIPRGNSSSNVDNLSLQSRGTQIQNLVQNDLRLVNDGETAIPVKSSICPVFGCRMCHRAFHTLAEVKNHIPRSSVACSGAQACNIELLKKDLELKLGLELKLRKKPGPLTTLDYVRQGVMVAGQAAVTARSASDTADLREPEPAPSLTFTCEECKFSFPSWPEFMKHMDYVPQKRPAVCPDLAVACEMPSGTSSAAEKESDDDPELSCSCSFFCDDASHSSGAVGHQSCAGKDLKRRVGKSHHLSNDTAHSSNPTISNKQKTRRKKGDQDSCPGQKKRRKKGNRDNRPVVPMYLVCNNDAKVEKVDFENEKTADIKTNVLKSASYSQECSSHSYSRESTSSPSDPQFISSSDKETNNRLNSCNYSAFSQNMGSSTAALQNSFEDDDDDDEQKPNIESLKFSCELKSEISLDSDKDTSSVYSRDTQPFDETFPAKSDLVSGKNPSAPSVVCSNSPAAEQEMTSDLENDSLIMPSNSETDALWAVYVNEDA